MSKAPALKPPVALVADDPRLETSLVLDGTPYDIGHPVIHWWEPGGFDGYVTERVVVQEQDRKTGKVTAKVIKGPRYSPRKLNRVTQFVLHHSGGDGRDPANMYRTLWFQRGLSVQYAVEDDGRIYQFLDARECAWHAGKHNGLSIGVEATLFPIVESDPNYYSPANCAARGNQPHAQRVEVLQGRPTRVYVMPPKQVYALARLVAGTWAALRHSTGLARFEQPPKFPQVGGTIPMSVVDRPLDHVGMIGHLHCTAAKIDPAGFPWAEFQTMVAGIFREMHV